MSELVPAAVRPPVGEPGEPAAVPLAVGAVWFLLVINVLRFLPDSNLIILIPRAAGQMITMGSLVAAFGLALVLNPRVRVRPSAYLFLLSLLALVSVVASIRLESGFGSIFRCFRLVFFVLTLWLVSRWWRPDLRFARYHLRAVSAVLLTVVAGMVISPGAAFSGPGGRLVGALWPIPSTQVGLYGAVAAGLCVVLWVTRSIDGRSVVIITLPAVVLLVLSHTRTAMLGLLAGLLIAGLSLVLNSGRARRALAAGIGSGGVVMLVFGQAIQNWLARGQNVEELAGLTGRQQVWDLLLATHRTPVQQLFGVGLTDKSFGGLPIDGSWPSIYYEQGWAGVVIVAAFLGCLLVTAALRPPSPARACAVFLIAYCIFASYTEAGLSDASPYLLNLALAAALLAHAPAAAASTRRFASIARSSGTSQTQ